MRSKKNESERFLSAFFNISKRYLNEIALIDIDSNGVEKEYSYKAFSELVEINYHHIKTEFGSKKQLFIGLSLPKTASYYALMLAIMESGHVYIPLPILPVPQNAKEQYFNQLHQKASKLYLDAVICATSQTSRWQKTLFEDNRTISNFSTDLTCISTKNRVDRGKDFPPKKTIAYIINTSGTTSDPKSIVIGQKCLIPTIKDSIKLMSIPIGAGLRVLQRSELTKDPSIFELLIGLLSGNCVVSFQESPNATEAMTEMPAIVKKYKINILLSPPDRLSFYRENHYAFTNWFKTLQYLLSTTDKASPETLNYYADTGIQVFDGYGPTETTIGLMICKLDSKSPYQGKLGNIYNHTFKYRTVKVFDTDDISRIKNIESGQGELCVSGEAVMLGYCENGILLLLTNDRLKDQRFIFGANKKMYYRTGDKVSISLEGDVTFLERISTHTKTSGNFSIAINDVKKRLEAKLSPVKLKKNHVTLVQNNSMFSVILPEDYMLSTDDMLHIMKKDAFSDTFPVMCFVNRPPLPKILFKFKSINTLSPINTQHDDAIAALITDLWVKTLGLEGLDVDHQVPFVLYGGNSSKHLLLIIALKNNLSVDVNINFFPIEMCLAELIDFCVALKAWEINTRHDNKTNKTLYYFPPLVGDSYGHYDNIAREINNNCNHIFLKCPLTSASLKDENLLLSYEKMMDRRCSQSVVDIEFTARVIANIIVTHSTETTHYFLGYSYGGLLAAATCYELLNLNHKIGYFGLVDAQAPREQRRLPIETQYQRLLFCVTQLTKLVANTEANRKINNKILSLDKVLTKKEIDRRSPKDDIKNLMEPLITYIDQLNCNLNDSSVNEIRRMFKTAYYHFLCSYDYEPSSNCVKLGAVYFYKAQHNETALDHSIDNKNHEKPLHPWAEYCAEQAVTEIKFAATHSNILAVNSGVIAKIAEHIKSIDKSIHFNEVFSLKSFYGRDEEFRSLQEALINTNQYNNIAKIVNVYGYGGIGKTTLVHKYRERIKENYSGTYYFNAASEETLMADYRKLVNYLDLNLEITDQSALVRTIVKWFATKASSLLIFDNISEDLNLLSIAPTQKQHCLLILSRIKLPNFKNYVTVGTLQQNQAIEFIQNELKPQVEANQDCLLALARQMGCMPLALSLSCSVIKMQQETTSGYCIQQFLDDYADPLTEKITHFIDTEIEYKETIASIYKMTFASISKACVDMNNFETVVNFFSIISPEGCSEYFYKKMVATLMGQNHLNENKLKNTLLLNTLKKHCVINIVERNNIKYYTIHRLIQDVIFDNIIPENQITLISKIFLELYHTKNPPEGSKEKTNDIQTEIIYHFERLYFHLITVLKHQLYGKRSVNSFTFNHIFILYTDLLSLTVNASDIKFDKVRKNMVVEQTLLFIAPLLINESSRNLFIEHLQNTEDTDYTYIEKSMTKLFSTLQSIDKYLSTLQARYMLLGNFFTDYWPNIIASNGVCIGYSLLIAWWVSTHNIKKLTVTLQEIILSKDETLSENEKNTLVDRTAYSLCETEQFDTLSDLATHNLTVRSPKTHFYHGIALFMTGKFNKAIKELSEARSLCTDSIEFTDVPPLPYIFYDYLRDFQPGEISEYSFDAAQKYESIIQYYILLCLDNLGFTQYHQEVLESYYEFCKKNPYIYNYQLFCHALYHAKLGELHELALDECTRLHLNGPLEYKKPSLALTESRHTIKPNSTLILQGQLDDFIVEELESTYDKICSVLRKENSYFISAKSICKNILKGQLYNAGEIIFLSKVKDRMMNELPEKLSDTDRSSLIYIPIVAMILDLINSSLGMRAINHILDVDISNFSEIFNNRKRQDIKNSTDNSTVFPRTKMTMFSIGNNDSNNLSYETDDLTAQIIEKLTHTLPEDTFVVPGSNPNGELIKTIIILINQYKKYSAASLQAELKIHSKELTDGLSWQEICQLLAVVLNKEFDITFFVDNIDCKETMLPIGRIFVGASSIVKKSEYSYDDAKNNTSDKDIVYIACYKNLFIPMLHLVSKNKTLYQNRSEIRRKNIFENSFFTQEYNIEAILEKMIKFLEGGCQFNQDNVTQVLDYLLPPEFKISREILSILVSSSKIREFASCILVIYSNLLNLSTEKQENSSTREQLDKLLSTTECIIEDNVITIYCSTSEDAQRMQVLITQEMSQQSLDISEHYFLINTDEHNNSLTPVVSIEMSVSLYNSLFIGEQTKPLIIK